jgi:hypothetical protein
VIGVWSIRENPWGTGPIYALDGAAREWTDWAAAAKGDSNLEEERVKVLSYPEVKEARAAARALREWRWPG